MPGCINRKAQCATKPVEICQHSDRLNNRSQFGDPPMAGAPLVPLLAPEAAGLDHVPGLNPGLISQNGDPPYSAESIQVIAHWLKDAHCARPQSVRLASRPIASRLKALWMSSRRRSALIRSNSDCVD